MFADCSVCISVTNVTVTLKKACPHFYKNQNRDTTDKSHKGSAVATQLHSWSEGAVSFLFFVGGVVALSFQLSLVSLAAKTGQLLVF